MINTKDTQFERRSLSEQLYETIKNSILLGDIKGGEKIPEETLAKEFNVSRTPIREAIRRLDEYGIVKVIPRSYAEVVTMTEEEAVDVIMVRRQLEILSASLLAERNTKEDINALKDLSKQCKSFLKEKNYPKVFMTDSLFHLEIANRSGNSVLSETLERLDAKIQLIRLLHCVSNDKIKETLKEHDELIKALENHNVKESIKIIKNHIV